MQEWDHYRTIHQSLRIVTMSTSVSALNVAPSWRGVWWNGNGVCSRSENPYTTPGYDPCFLLPSMSDTLVAAESLLMAAA